MSLDVHMEDRRIYKVEQTYLEMSRAFLGADIHCAKGTTSPNNNTILALVSSSYTFAIMAIDAFVSAQLHDKWSFPDSELHTKYSDACTFEDLMRKKLKDRKAAIKELCCQLKIQPIHIKQPNLWRQLNEVLKKTRDFFVHPNRDEFNDFMKVAGEQNSWAFPSNVASAVIRYFYEQTGTIIPDWLQKNVDFKVTKLETFR